MPSGVDSSTGEIAGVAVTAAATATFHAAKPGLWIAPGKAHAGEVTVVDIGIPAGAPVQAQIGLIEGSVTSTIPLRGRKSTKFAAGSVLVCGGSLGLTGAPSLASEAATRAGAGYVTAFVPSSLHQIFELRLLEVMTVPLPDLDGALQPDGADVIAQRAPGAPDALVLGPGLGRDAGAASPSAATSRAAPTCRCCSTPMGSTRTPSGSSRSPDASRADRADTPRGRARAAAGPAVGRDRAPAAAHARRAAALARAVVVLKGDDSIVAEPSGRVGVSRGGAPALATAGSGDVLSGVIGAYLAKRMDAFEAACAGVLVHARAGQLAAEWIGPEGVIARDVIEALPRARLSA